MRSTSEILQTFNPISLEEMSSVKLVNRTDTKFVMHIDLLPQLLVYAQKHYMVQLTDGLRLLPYETTYYDTAQYGMLHSHISGRLRRQKVRVRTYKSSAITFVEIKRKDNHGRTKKINRNKEVLAALACCGDFCFCLCLDWLLGEGKRMLKRRC